MLLVKAIVPIKFRRIGCGRFRTLHRLPSAYERYGIDAGARRRVASDELISKKTKHIVNDIAVQMPGTAPRVIQPLDCVSQPGLK
jgi:hypothetical protein